MNTSTARQPRAIDTADTNETTAPAQPDAARPTVFVDRETLWAALYSLRDTLGDLHFFDNHDTDDESLRTLARDGATIAHLAAVLHAYETSQPYEVPARAPIVDPEEMRRTLQVIVTDEGEPAPDVTFSGNDLLSFVVSLHGAVCAVSMADVRTITTEAANVLHDLSQRAEALAVAAQGAATYARKRAEGLERLKAKAKAFDVLDALSELTERRGAERPMQGHGAPAATEATDDGPDAARPE